jgi:hypothetical protein
MQQLFMKSIIRRPRLFFPHDAEPVEIRRDSRTPRMRLNSHVSAKEKRIIQLAIALLGSAMLYVELEFVT